MVHLELMVLMVQMVNQVKAEVVVQMVLQEMMVHLEPRVCQVNQGQLGLMVQVEKVVVLVLLESQARVEQLVLQVLLVVQV
jgi:hypothetical protein